MLTQNSFHRHAVGRPGMPGALALLCLVIAGADPACGVPWTLSAGIAVTDCTDTPRQDFIKGEGIVVSASHNCASPVPSAAWEYKLFIDTVEKATSSGATFVLNTTAGPEDPLYVSPGSHGVSVQITCSWLEDGVSHSQSASDGDAVTVHAPQITLSPAALKAHDHQDLTASDLPTAAGYTYAWHIAGGNFGTFPSTPSGSTASWRPEWNTATGVTHYSLVDDDIHVTLEVTGGCLPSAYSTMKTTTVVAVLNLVLRRGRSFAVGDPITHSDFDTIVTPAVTAHYDTHVTFSPDVKSVNPPNTSNPYTFQPPDPPSKTFTAYCGSSNASCDVPVCGACTACASAPGTGGAGPLDSVSVWMNVGTAGNYGSAGSIRLRAPAMAPALGTPAALLYGSTLEVVEVLRDGAALHQILTPQAFIDVVTLSAYAYEVRFYDDNDAGSLNQQGFYDVVANAEPHTVWTVENPDADPAVYNRLQVTRDAGGAEEVWLFVYTPATGAWSLASGNGLRVESRTGGTDNEGNRYEDVSVAVPGGATAAKTRIVYDDLPWGEAVVREVRDPDGSALASECGYYTDSAEAGRYTRLAWQTEADGGWRTYDYDYQGRTVETLAAWKDLTQTQATASNCRRTAYDYAPVDEDDDGTVRPTSPRTVEEYIEGELVSRTWHAYYTDGSGHQVEITERAADQAADYGDTGNARSFVLRHPDNAAWPLSGRTESVLSPDGRLTSYTYAAGVFVPDDDYPGDSTFTPGNGPDLRITQSDGTLDSPDGVPYQSTRTVTIIDAAGNQVMSQEWVCTDTDYARLSWRYSEFDDFGHAVRTRRSDGTGTTAVWSNCCGQESEALADGTEIEYAYDDLGRLTTRVKVGYGGRADVTTSYTLDAEGRQTAETVSSDGLNQTTESEYDLAGRLSASADTAGLVTEYDYASGGRVTTVTRPGGATEVTENYRDGRVKSRTGTAFTPLYYDYGVNGDGTQWTTVYTGEIPQGGEFTDIPMWQKTTTDLLGRSISVEKPVFGGQATSMAASYYNGFGQLVRSGLTSDGNRLQADTLYEYDELGQVFRSGLDVDNDGELVLESDDRIHENEAVYEQDESDDWWHVTTSRTYATADDDTATVTGVSKRRLTGLGASGDDGVLTAESASTDIHGGDTVSQTWTDAETKTVTEITDTPDSDTDAGSVTVNGLPVSSTTPAGLTTSYTYDAIERQTLLNDPRTGDSETHYNSLGQVDWVEDAAGNRTEFAYDEDTGRRIAVTDPLDNVVYTAYADRGEVWRTWGGGAYPVEYTYDAHGRMVAMSTFRGGTGWSGSTWPASPGDADTTEWIYEDVTGLLTAKTYADDSTVLYAYDEAGRLAARAWARIVGNDPVTTGYSYDAAAGDLTEIDYSDSTPDVSFTYTRTGLKASVTDVLGTRTFTYNAALQEATEYVPGTYFQKLITRKYDALGRNAGFSIGTANDPDADYDVDYEYDSAGRFAEVATAVPSTFSATYDYLEDSTLVETVTFPNSITATKSYEATRDLLTAVENKVGQTTVSKYEYTNDAAGRRTQSGWSGSAFSQGDTISYGYNSRSELTSAVATNRGTYDFEYAYDNIGNRTDYTVDGGTPTSYDANELNQYTVTADPTEAFLYDDDGNMIEDGEAEYTWDAENRLVGIQKSSSKAEYTYDYMGRRVRARTWSWSGSQWDLTRDVRFLYDQWNLTWEETVIPGTGSDVGIYTWGLDLSGTLHGAGGVGGLLHGSNISITGVPFYDGNGNICQNVSTSGTVMMHFEYDPYGFPQMVYGSPCLPFCFSTKYWDVFIGSTLNYYGYRYYSPRLGRWISSDPSGEGSGANLSAFVDNAPVHRIDGFGLAPFADLSSVRDVLVPLEARRWGEFKTEWSIRLGDRLISPRGVRCRRLSGGRYRFSVYAGPEMEARFNSRRFTDIAATRAAGTGAGANAVPWARSMSTYQHERYHAYDFVTRWNRDFLTAMQAMEAKTYRCGCGAQMDYTLAWYDLVKHMSGFEADEWHLNVVGTSISASRATWYRWISSDYSRVAAAAALLATLEAP